MQVNNAILSLVLEFGSIHDGKTMNVSIQHGSNSITVVPNGSGDTKVSFPVTLPGTVCLFFSGKDSLHDTIVDSDGKILQDLFVKIKDISLDGFRTFDSMIHRFFVLETDCGQTIPTAYVGFNGKIEFHMSHSDVFSQIMHWRRDCG